MCESCNAQREVLVASDWIDVHAAITKDAPWTPSSAYDTGRVVQAYVANPMLLNGLKFDRRLYVLLTSVGGADDGGPPQCFLCREGLVRFATARYVRPPRDADHVRTPLQFEAQI